MEIISWYSFYKKTLFIYLASEKTLGSHGVLCTVRLQNVCQIQTTKSNVIVQGTVFSYCRRVGKNLAVGNNVSVAILKA